MRQVKDVATIERSLHRRHVEVAAAGVTNTRELFNLTIPQARQALADIPDADLNAPAPVNQLRIQPDFIGYLLALFRHSGIENFRDLQESWTFSLFPSTAGGRFFTLNIDRHEVAFSQPVQGEKEYKYHSIIVDEMVLWDKEIKRWLKPIRGKIHETPYKSNWGRSVSIDFEATFDEAVGLFELTGFRRALIAYWYEALLRMQDRQTRSLFARFHNYDATSEIFRHLRETRDFRTQLAR